ncbi:MAG: DUF177 domain-containing protein [Endomicrobia bacterium]|nr:DUF177 domain-containing protein [Endomicrobiia bacterium]
MKISIDRIRKESQIILTYEDEQFKSEDFVYQTIGPLIVNIILSLAGNENIRIKGEITGKFNLICDRCCAEFVEDKKICFDEVFELEKKEIVEHIVNIDTKIRDLVLTSFPMKILCDKECKGICLKCGVNLNKEECKCRY